MSSLSFHAHADAQDVEYYYMQWTNNAQQHLDIPVRSKGFFAPGIEKWRQELLEEERERAPLEYTTADHFLAMKNS